MKIFGSITELVSLILRKGTQAITVKPNQTVTYTADRDVQLPPQDANAVLVSESASQTLTNKTLTSPAISSPTGLVKGDVGLGNVDNTSDATKDSASATLTNKTISAASNTLTNIANASISASAAIDATKINTGVVSNTEFNYLDGVTSAIQTQLGNKAATGANSDITSLSALSTPLSIPQGGTGQITANAAVNALLPSQTSAVNRFLRTDGSNTSWASAGGGVGKNYLQDQYDADASISVQQSVGNTLASSTRLNPTYFGSSDASLPLISVSVDGTLRPLNNYLIAFASNGQFIETPLFSLDGIDLGKAMAVAFAVTGVGAADDVQTYMARYNSSNVLQERIPIAGIASATSPNSAQVPTGTTNFRGFFIPSSTSGDKYAVRILRNATNTSMRIDALVVGPSSIQTGTAITDWQSFTGSSSSWTNTNSNYNGKFQRVGDSANFQFYITLTGAGTSTFSMTSAQFFGNSGLTINTSKLSGSGSGEGTVPVGKWSGLDFGVQNFSGIVYWNPNDSTFRLVRDINIVSATSPFTWAAGDIIGIHVEDLPITGWSSNVTMADRAVEEFISVTATTGTPTIIAGASGSVVPTTTPSGTYEEANLGTNPFSSALLSTDLLTIEVDRGAVGKFLPLSGASIENLRYDGTNYIGLGIYISGTTLFLLRGKYIQGTNTAWSTIPAGTRFRIRKVSGGAAVGFPIAPANITLINSTDNYTGNTKLGFMQYASGGSYFGGLAPTVTGQAGFALSTSAFIPYQMSDGSWRMRFNISYTQTSGTAADVAVAGVSAVLAGVAARNLSSGTSQTSASMLVADIVIRSTVAGTNFAVGGDVTLNSKPTWAY